MRAGASTIDSAELCQFTFLGEPMASGLAREAAIRPGKDRELRFAAVSGCERDNGLMQRPGPSRCCRSVQSGQCSESGGRERRNRGFRELGAENSHGDAVGRQKLRAVHWMIEVDR